MTSLRMIQLAGFAIAAAGLGFMFFSARQRLGRALSAVGGLIVVAGYAASPEFRDPEFWKQPVVYLGLLIGLGLPFAIAALSGRRPRS